MNSSQNYKWEPGEEHAWIAEDADGFLAYMTCSINTALPDKVNIERRLMSGLDLRLKTLFDLSHSNLRDWFEPFAALGFFVYDAIRVKDGWFAFKMVARPIAPITVDVLPSSLRAVAMCFSVGNTRFNSTPLLPICNLFSYNEEDENPQRMSMLAIDTIQHVANPRVSVWERAGFCPAREYVVRGCLNLRAVLGFTDVKNRVATIFDWKVYIGCFASFLNGFSRIKKVHNISFQTTDSCWHDLNDNADAIELLNLPPKCICLRDRFGHRIADIELLEQCSNAAHDEYCRYLIRCARRDYKVIVGIIVSAARMLKYSVDLMPAKHCWMLKVVNKVFQKVFRQEKQ